MESLKVGDIVSLNGHTGTVTEVARVARTETRIVRLQAWFSNKDVWYRSEDLTRVPPPKPQYELVPSGGALIAWSPGVGGRPVLYAYDNAGLSRSQQHNALRVGMAALGYEEKV